MSRDYTEPLVEEDQEDSKPSSEKGDDDDRIIPSEILEDGTGDFFGESSESQAERIKQDSPFKHLKTWRLVHIIVKSGADMKEEQFAIQLISQFDQIFKNEKSKLILTPYEILSLGTQLYNSVSNKSRK